MSRYGIVVEQNFANIVTYSVGQVRVGELLATYYGTQSLTKDNRATEVYGGSTLIVARGDYDALLKLDIPPNVESIISKARAYEAAVSAVFPDWMASRRNYDVAEVTDSATHCGVLEQSWRIGGTSPAEVAALHAFQADPALDAVRAASAEVYGTTEVPPEASVHFQGVDERLDPMAKYAPDLRPPQCQFAMSPSILPSINEIICGTLFKSAARDRQPCYLPMAGAAVSNSTRERAYAVAELGFLCLTFDLRGHARHEGPKKDRLARRQPARSARRLRSARQPGRARTRRALGLVGSSYGAYLGSHFDIAARGSTGWRSEHPALYKDANWELPKD